MDCNDYRHGKRRRSNSLDLLGDDSSSTKMEHMPLEIVHDILSRLPITSLLQFKSVSRPWRALAQDPQLVNSYHLSRTAQPNDPCLILHCDFPIQNRLCFVDLQEKVHKVRGIRTLPFWQTMQEFEVVGSCNGLLCLSDSLFTEVMHIYNPFTGQFTQLPISFKYPDQEVVFGFGFHPKTKEYKVIKIVYYRNGHSHRARRVIYPQSETQVLTLGSSPVWRSLGKVPYRLLRRPSEALVNGRLHWVCRPCRSKPARRLVSFDLADEQFREVLKPDCGSLNRFNYHLVVVKGCLSAAVYCNYGRLEIWVMMEYNVKESWVKHYSIGSYMPKGLRQNLDRPFKLWKSGLNGKVVRVLCVLKNGEILLEYKGRVLVSYDPRHGKFKDLRLQGLPAWFQTVVHVGSLNWLDTPINT